MRAAFSNIGWARHDDEPVFAKLRAARVSGIGVAPTKVWPDWNGASESAARAYARFLGDLGFAVPAMQAVLFGKPELRLFDTAPAARRAFEEHFRSVADLA